MAKGDGRGERVFVLRVGCDSSPWGSAWSCGDGEGGWGCREELRGVEMGASEPT